MKTYGYLEFLKLLQIKSQHQSKRTSIMNQNYMPTLEIHTIPFYSTKILSSIATLFDYIIITHNHQSQQIQSLSTIEQQPLPCQGYTHIIDTIHPIKIIQRKNRQLTFKISNAGNDIKRMKRDGILNSNILKIQETDEQDEDIRIKQLRQEKLQKQLANLRNQEFEKKKNKYEGSMNRETKNSNYTFGYNGELILQKGNPYYKRVTQNKGNQKYKINKSQSVIGELEVIKINGLRVSNNGNLLQWKDLQNNYEKQVELIKRIKQQKQGILQQRKQSNGICFPTIQVRQLNKQKSKSNLLYHKFRKSDRKNINPQFNFIQKNHQITKKYYDPVTHIQKQIQIHKI